MGLVWYGHQKQTVAFLWAESTIITLVLWLFKSEETCFIEYLLAGKGGGGGVHCILQLFWSTSEDSMLAYTYSYSPSKEFSIIMVHLYIFVCVSLRARGNILEGWSLIDRESSMDKHISSIWNSQLKHDLLVRSKSWCFCIAGMILLVGRCCRRNILLDARIGNACARQCHTYMNFLSRILPKAFHHVCSLPFCLVNNSLARRSELSVWFASNFAHPFQLALIIVTIAPFHYHPNLTSRFGQHHPLRPCSFAYHIPIYCLVVWMAFQSSTRRFIHGTKVYKRAGCYLVRHNSSKSHFFANVRLESIQIMLQNFHVRLLP
jgi:hypothetical protein